MFYRSYITLIIISQFYFHLTVLLAFHILNITSWCLYCFITPLSRTEQTNICWCAVKILLAQHHTTQSWVYFPFLSMSSSSFQSHSPVCYSRCPVVSCLESRWSWWVHCKALDICSRNQLQKSVPYA